MVIHIAIAVAIIFVLVIAAILIVAATRPNTFRIYRTAMVAAAPARIFPHINDFRNWVGWSPYERLDPDMKKTYGGAASGKGAVYEWAGNAKAGAGRMEIVESSPPDKIIIKLDFLKPFEGHNIAEFTILPKGDATEVTWAIQGPVPFVMKIMHLVLNMDRLIGKDFEAGLANLNAVVVK